MSGNKIGAYKAKTGFGKSGYKPGGMISKMNKNKKARINKIERKTV